MEARESSRQEIAKRLRDKYRERNTPGVFVAQDVGMQAYDYLKDLESCLPDGDSMFTVLADLIDPTCHIVCVDDTYNTPETGRVDEWHYECSKCGIELDDNDMDAMDSGVKPFDYCKKCGARVVNFDE